MADARYHFTCDHGAAGILRTGRVLSPKDRGVDARQAARILPPQMLTVTWWTDLEHPDRDALGLTSDSLPCDRTGYRFRATSSEDLVPFLDWEQQQNATVRAWCAILTGLPRHWWVTTEPVPVVLDQLTAVPA